MITKAFDLETFLITRERPAPPPVCLSWYDGKRGAVIPHGPALKGWIERQLKDPGVHLVGHNVAYDFKVLCAAYPDLTPLVFQAYEAGRVTDTGIRQQLCFIAMRPSFDEKVPNYSLARLVAMIFDRDISARKSGPDAWRLRYEELYGRPFDLWPDAAVDYPLSDARETWLVWNAQEQQTRIEIRDDAFQTYAAFALSLIECRGMRTDPKAVAELEARNIATMERVRPKLIEVGLVAKGGTKKNPKWTKKDKAARDIMGEMCAKRGAEPMLTKSKAIAIDKAACLMNPHPMLKLRAEYALAEKVLSTYVPPLQAGIDSLITTRFGMASTTRTTSSGPGKRGPAVGTNMQNAPRDGGIRECFVPRPGYLLLAADLGSAELHTLAQVCKRKLGHSTLGDLLASGEDAHLYLASKLLGVPFEDAKARKQDGDPAIKKARQHAKPGNFGFGGAMGPKTFVKSQAAAGVLYTMDEARALKSAWLQAYPEMQEYFNACLRELGPDDSAIIELWPGGPLRRVKGLSMIANSYFQAPAARGAKMGVCAVVEASQVGPLRGEVFPCNFVHDEVVAEVKVTTASESAGVFARLMQDSFNEMVPDYPTKVEPALMYRYSKGAESVFDSGGQLIPWTEGN